MDEVKDGAMAETDGQAAAWAEECARHQRALLAKVRSSDKAAAAQAAVELLAWYAENGVMDDAGVQAAIEQGEHAVLAKVLAAGLGLVQGARVYITPLDYFRSDGRGGGRFTVGAKGGLLQLRDVLEANLTREDVIEMLTVEDGGRIAPEKRPQTVGVVERGLVLALAAKYGVAKSPEVTAFVRASVDEFWPQPWGEPNSPVDYDDLL